MSITLIIFAILFTVFFAIKPVKFYRLDLNIITASLIFFFMLLFTGVINLSIIKNGILGYESLKPLEILVIFYTVAYVSISVDLSGILDFFAFKIVKYSKSNGYILFSFIYFFASILTVFTSNDIVILTLTPIIFYLKKHSNINIIPLLFAEFFAANTASMLLYIGNPTNIIIANATGIRFNEYLRVMYIPTLVATFSNYFLLLFFFRNKISKKFTIKQDSVVNLRSIYDAVFSIVLLVAMLIILFISERLNIKIWLITSIFALIFIAEDLIIYFYYTIKNYSLYKTEMSFDLKKIYSIFGFQGERYDFFIVGKRLPWKLMPFIVVIFIFIYSLTHYGIFDIISSLLSNITELEYINSAIYGTISFMLANIINNQPMAIFFSNVLINNNTNLSNVNYQIVSYSVIIASNLGANLTLIGALAGLMWEKILKERNLRISYLTFLKIGMKITPIVFFLTIISLCLSYKTF